MLNTEGAYQCLHDATLIIVPTNARNYCLSTSMKNFERDNL